jgi:MiaB/RimO family radical SAM methylthiotransferase
VHLVSLGCAKNLVDSERLLGEALRALDAEPCLSPEEADLVMVNTCAFVRAAQEEAVSAIFDLKSRMRPDARLAVLGCLAALPGADLASELPEADLVLPVGGYAPFPERLRRLFPPAGGAASARDGADDAVAPGVSKGSGVKTSEGAGAGASEGAGAGASEGAGADTSEGAGAGDRTADSSAAGGSGLPDGGDSAGGGESRAVTKDLGGPATSIGEVAGGSESQAGQGSCESRAVSEDLGGPAMSIAGAARGPLGPAAPGNGQSGAAVPAPASFESWERALLGTPRFRSYMKIAEGCSRRCTYCLIPSIRGPQAPVPLDALVREAEGLARAGALELTLVAQDLTAWKDGGRDLRHLCRALGETGIRWIRLMYLHPEALSRPLVEALRDVPAVVPYLDVPFQHSSPKILKAMGRGRTMPMDTVRMIRGAWPEAAIRTTLMTGFPGETEEDFLSMLEFVEEARLDHVGFFKFSPEDGTPAARMGGAVPRGVAERRRRSLASLQRRVSRKLNRARVGSVVEVLVEGPSEDAPEVTCGRGSFQAPDADGLVYFDGEQPRAGQIVRARILKAGDYDLTAELQQSWQGGPESEAEGGACGAGSAGRVGKPGKPGKPGKANMTGRSGKAGKTGGDVCGLGYVDGGATDVLADGGDARGMGDGSFGATDVLADGGDARGMGDGSAGATDVLADGGDLGRRSAGRAGDSGTLVARETGDPDGHKTASPGTPGSGAPRAGGVR